MYNHNQADIEKYAWDILTNGFPTGIFMIDDNWQKYYGNFEFKPDKFPDPAGMITRLHEQGFKVMLWICPFVSPDRPEFRLLAKKGYLVKKKNNNSPAMINWWNGVSAVSYTHLPVQGIWQSHDRKPLCGKLVFLVPVLR